MRVHRREMLRSGVATGLGLVSSGWFRAFAADAAAHPERARSCIMLWLNGGPSTIDLWDLKPGHDNGGPFKAIETAVPGLRISEHLPKVARLAEDVAIVRSMSTKEGDHTRASHLARTGNIPQGAIQFPGLGALVAKELRNEESDLPGYVSIAPPGGQAEALGYSSGFLGPRFTPLMVGSDNGPIEDLAVPDLTRPLDISERAFAERLRLIDLVDRDFRGSHQGAVLAAQREAAAQALRVMRPESARAFQLEEESSRLRGAYGKSAFGQGCLMARRLVERGVPFVEVTLGGWDTHNDNFAAVATLSRTLDAGLGTLLSDLKQRGLLETTLVVCMGEFGRTPRINGRNGRDHWPGAWSLLVAGGGLKTGRGIGHTSADGSSVESQPANIPDVLATLCQALGIDHLKQNDSNVGRPIRIVDRSARVIKELLS